MFHQKAFSSNIKSNHIKDNICKSSNDSFIGNSVFFYQYFVQKRDLTFSIQIMRLMINYLQPLAFELATSLRISTDRSHRNLTEHKPNENNSIWKLCITQTR